jgi:molybdopterin molybdotransferase
MIQYEEALQVIQQRAANLKIEIEELPLLSCMGRVLAEDLFSPENIPAADNSAMDGFAIQSQDTRGASPDEPVKIKILGILAAGADAENWNFSKGQGLEIMTGAILPCSTLNAVVRVEDIERQGEFILIKNKVVEFSHIRKAGTDFQIGQKIANQGTILNEQHVLALAALGLHTIKVFRKVRVAVISTGTEIVDYSLQKLKPNQVRNSSSPYLKVFLEKHHCQVDLLGSVKDEILEFGHLMQLALAKKYDFIVTTGAVSAGKWDFVTGALPDFNFQVLFHKAAIRPGKPILFAQSKSQSTFFFGLPGNPISTAVGAQYFILPLLKKAMFLPESQEIFELVHDVKKPIGFECFYKARKVKAIPVEQVQVLPGQMSYMIHSFIESNCWVQLPAGSAEIKANTKIKGLTIK